MATYSHLTPSDHTKADLSNTVVADAGVASQMTAIATDGGVQLDSIQDEFHNLGEGMAHLAYSVGGLMNAHANTLELASQSVTTEASAVAANNIA